MSEPAAKTDDQTAAAKTGKARQESVEKPDAEFLEYLATVEGDEDDWTLFAGDQDAAKAKAPAESAAAPKPKESDNP